MNSRNSTMRPLCKRRKWATKSLNDAAGDALPQPRQHDDGGGLRFSHHEHRRKAEMIEVGVGRVHGGDDRGFALPAAGLGKQNTSIGA
jgi:hypothetical protein